MWLTGSVPITADCGTWNGNAGPGCSPNLRLGPFELALHRSIRSTTVLSRRQASHEIAMTSHCDDELTSIAREIATKQLYIENQTILIEALERDGHDVLEQRKNLARERSGLATQIARQFQLLETRCT
jgi:hypothetical protein